MYIPQYNILPTGSRIVESLFTPWLLKKLSRR